MERRNERTRETIDNLVGFFPGDLSKFHFMNLLTSPAENVELAAKKQQFFGLCGDWIFDHFSFETTSNVDGYCSIHRTNKKAVKYSFMATKRAIIFIISAREARLHIRFNCVSQKRVIRFVLIL